MRASVAVKQWGRPGPLCTLTTATAEGTAVQLVEAAVIADWPTLAATFGLADGAVANWQKPEEVDAPPSSTGNHHIRSPVIWACAT